MDRWITALLMCLTAPMFAHASTTPELSPEPAILINPLQLKCSLRDSKFLTEISFSQNSQGEVVGEVANFVSTGGHNRQYLNGNILFDLIVGSTTISGNTGDRRGNVSAFKLTQLGYNPDGTWVYEQFEHTGPVIRSRFNCSYLSH
jgi:hypothetical protein